MADGTGSKTDTQDARIGEIVSDLYDRKLRGEPLNEEEILRAYPDLASNLERYLAVIGGVRQAESTVSGLIAQGVLAPADGSDRAGRLGAYRTVAYLGRGGMGIVLKAVDENLNRVVAIKILRPDWAEDKNALARFSREAKAAAALHHPNIVSIYAFGYEHGTGFLVMEYVDGPNLTEVIRRHGPLPTETIRHLFGQLLAGLAAAHDAGIVHRDIKSANLLLDYGSRPSEPSRRAGMTAMKSCGKDGSEPPSVTATNSCGKDSSEPPSVTAMRPCGEDGSEPPSVTAMKPASSEEAPPSQKAARNPAAGRDRQSAIHNLQSAIVKLADFGLARVLTAESRLTLPQSAMGTPEYMSPEQARGDDNIDQRTDLYSAGVVLYEMLAGRTPFRADTPTAVLYQILHVEPSDTRSINKAADKQLSALALRLMAKRPEDRFDSAQQVLAALEAGSRVRLPERWRRFRRRVIAMTLILPCLAALLWLGRSQSSSQPSKAEGGAGRSIASVRGERDKIKVMYEGKSEWKDFHAFRYQGDPGTSAVLATDAFGRRIIVAGTNEVIDGECVFAFNEDGTARWSTHIPSSVSWPDMQGEPLWISSVELAADLDGNPGDEVLVYQHDRYEYASCLAILDPSTATVRGVLWHTGHLFTPIWLEERCIDGQRPGIVVCGSNNKFDGFQMPQEGDPPPQTTHDIVSIAMIVDPQQMLREREGLAPPHAPRIGLPPLKPYAYAFLDMEKNANAVPVSGEDAHGSPRQSDEVAWIDKIDRSGVSDAGSTVLLDVTIGRRDNDGCHLIVDSGLAVKRVIESSVAPSKKDDPGYWDRFWRSRWRVIIRNGEYVDLPNAERAGAPNQ